MARPFFFAVMALRDKAKLESAMKINQKRDGKEAGQTQRRLFQDLERTGMLVRERDKAING